LRKAGALKRGDENSIGIARKIGEILSWNEIDLVQVLKDRFLRDFKFSQDLFNLCLLLFAHRTGSVLNVEKNFRAFDLF
jgi:hypothetical protein